MKYPNSFSHLTLEERRIILTGITNGSTKAAIAQTIDKDKSTVGKEIRLHKILSHKRSLPLECSAYRKCVHVLLTDRGSEFTAAEATETHTDSTRRTRVFYCDSMQSGQKGILENKHVELRYILPKGTDLRALGLAGQTQLNLVLCHVNSSPSELFGGKSPLELTEFMYHDLHEKLYAFGIRQIEKDQVILKPYLLETWTKK